MELIRQLGIGPVEISRMHAGERSFVCRSWVQGYVEAQGHGKRSNSKHRSAYLVKAGSLVDDMLQRDWLEVLVARDPECSALAYGWIAGQPGTVHWCYVKHAYRRHGLAGELLDAFDGVCGPLGRYSLRSLHDGLAERRGLKYSGRAA